MVDTNKILNTLDDSQEAEACGPKVASELTQLKVIVSKLKLMEDFKRQQTISKKTAAPNATIINDGEKSEKELSKDLESKGLGTFFKTAPVEAPTVESKTAAKLTK
jgi:hypothetical protein